jgi:hypothetical protein
MKSPPESAKSNRDDPLPSHTFENPDDLLEGERTRDDYLAVALQLREATPIAAIAERANRGTDSAREYMRWFETMGLVRKAGDDPERYETNRAYLYWRRVDDVRQRFADAEIVEKLQTVVDEIDELTERYGTTDPDEVDLVAEAEQRETSVEEIWDERSHWQTLLARRDLLEDALDHEPDRYQNPATGEGEESASQVA